MVTPQLQELPPAFTQTPIAGKRGTRGFDTSHPGTPEAVWRSALAQAPAWTPPPGDLLIVSPHPDDETLAAGGLMRTWCRLGFKVTVLLLTDGEAACRHWPNLGEHRAKELKEALDHLAGGKIRLVRLRIPDGRLGRARRRVRAALEDLRSEIGTLICPYEADGHPDHEAAGQISLEFARAAGLGVVRYPIWFWHRSPSAALEGLDPHRFWLDHATEEVKAQAIVCFGSQLSGRGEQAPVVPAHVVRYFRRPYEIFFL